MNPITIIASHVAVIGSTDSICLRRHFHICFESTLFMIFQPNTALTRKVVKRNMYIELLIVMWALYERFWRALRCTWRLQRLRQFHHYMGSWLYLVRSIRWYMLCAFLFLWFFSTPCTIPYQTSRTSLNAAVISLIYVDDAVGQNIPAVRLLNSVLLWWLMHFSNGSAGWWQRSEGPDWSIDYAVLFCVEGS